MRATSITSGAGTVTDASDYTSFGELQHYVAKYNGTPFFEQTYTRDTLGRITSITETLTIAPDPPATTVKFYKYDTAGRLWRVCPDDACTTITSEYLYDPNGNRLAGSFNQSGMLTAAVYDDQDRLISTQSSILGPQSYTYTANGEEQTKTDASGQTTYTYDALGNLRQVVTARRHADRLRGRRPQPADREEGHCQQCHCPRAAVALQGPARTGGGARRARNIVGRVHLWQHDYWTRLHEEGRTDLPRCQ